MANIIKKATCPKCGHSKCSVILSYKSSLKLKCSNCSFKQKFTSINKNKIPKSQVVCISFTSKTIKAIIFGL